MPTSGLRRRRQPRPKWPRRNGLGRPHRRRTSTPPSPWRITLDHRRSRAATTGRSGRSHGGSSRGPRANAAPPPRGSRLRSRSFRHLTQDGPPRPPSCRATPVSTKAEGHRPSPRHGTSAEGPRQTDRLDERAQRQAVLGGPDCVHLSCTWQARSGVDERGRGSPPSRVPSRSHPVWGGTHARCARGVGVS